jgi:DNA-binding response OmpR family regulator
VQDTILVVDDETVVRTFVANACRARGFRALIAQDGQHGLEVYLENQAEIDLLLTDISMPRLSGPQLARRVRQYNPNLPVLMMTGFSPTMVVPTDLFNCPMLRKPFTVDVLVNAMRKTLQIARGSSSSAYAD